MTADDLAGRTFLLEQAEVGGQPKELAGGKPIGLTFEQGRLSAQPGCNGVSGDYTLEDGRIVLGGELAQTMMMCADEALVEQDAWFATVLEAKPLVSLDGDAITLTTDDTVLQGRDKEVASPDLPLEGTEWRIESRIEGSGPDAAVSTELWMEESQLVFEPGGRLQGATACGGVLGTWTLDGDAVTIVLEPHGPCQSPDDPGKGEEKTFSLLAGDDLTLSVDADQATLTHPDGSGVVLRAQTAVSTGAPDAPDHQRLAAGGATPPRPPRSRTPRSRPAARSSPAASAARRRCPRVGSTRAVVPVPPSQPQRPGAIHGSAASMSTPVARPHDPPASTSGSAWRRCSSVRASAVISATASAVTTGAPPSAMAVKKRRTSARRGHETAAERREERRPGEDPVRRVEHLEPVAGGPVGRRQALGRRRPEGRVGHAERPGDPLGHELGQRHRPRRAPAARRARRRRCRSSQPSPGWKASGRPPAGRCTRRA